MKTNKQANWTVFFLIKGAATYGDLVVNLVNELLNGVKDTSVNVVFCLNSQVKTIKDILPVQYPNLGALGEEEMTTVFFRIAFSKYESSFEFIEEDKCFNIRTEKSVGDFFKTTILKGVEAKRYILCTWDHGAAFGIFRERENKPYVDIVANKNPSQDIFYLFKFRSFIENRSAFTLDTASNDKIKKLLAPESFDMLTADELDRAIKWAFGKAKIDIVIMMNCFMQYFDVGYALRDSVHYLIAPEELIMLHIGYDYTRLLDLISQDPDIPLDKLSADIITSFGKKSNQKGEAAIIASANKLSYYEQLGVLINRLSRSMIKNIDKDFWAIHEAIKESWEMDTSGNLGYHLRDLFLFFKILFSKNQSSVTQSDITELATLQRLTVRYLYIADGKYTINSAPSGISLFMPETNEINNDFYRTFILENSRQATEVSRNFLWDNFIKRYMEKIKEIPVF